MSFWEITFHIFVVIEINLDWNDAKFFNESSDILKENKEKWMKEDFVVFLYPFNREIYIVFYSTIHALLNCPNFSSCGKAMGKEGWTKYL